MSSSGWWLGFHRSSYYRDSSQTDKGDTLTLDGIKPE